MLSYGGGSGSGRGGGGGGGGSRHLPSWKARRHMSAKLWVSIREVCLKTTNVLALALKHCQRNLARLGQVEMIWEFCWRLGSPKLCPSYMQEERGKMYSLEGTVLNLASFDRRLHAGKGCSGSPKWLCGWCMGTRWEWIGKTLVR